MAGHVLDTLSRKRIVLSRIAVPLLALVVLGFAGWVTERYNEAERLRQSTLLAQQIQVASSALRSTLEAELNASLHLSSGMYAYVRARNGNVMDDGVQSILQELASQRTNIRNMAVAPGNRIRFIYPVQGNEAALGLFYPDVPEQWSAVEYVIREKKPLLVGPINLVQGGQGFIYRMPVYLGENVYWGLISSVIDAQSIYSILDETAALYNVKYQLITPQTSGAHNPDAVGAMEIPISLLGATWTLYVYRLAGQTPKSSAWITRLLGWGIGVLIALVLLFGALAYEKERKLALQQAENDAKLRKLSNQLPGILYMFERSQEGKYSFTYTSTSNELLLGGLSPSHLNNFEEVLHFYVPQEERASFIESVERSAAQQSVWNHTFSITRPTGEVRFIEAISQPELREDQTVRWYGFATDVTERRRVQRKIEEQEARHHAILKALPDLLLTIDVDGRVQQVEVGPSSPEYFPHEDAVGQPFAALFPTECAADCEAIMHRVRETEKGVALTLRRFSEAQTRWFEIRLEPIHDRQGHILAILRDVTDAREAQEALLRMNEQLESARVQAQELAEKAEAASRAKSAFLAMMSHEIRTPMNGILGMTELLRDSGLNEDQRSYADIVFESSEALLDLLNNVLEISAIEMGTATVRIESTPVRKLAADVLSLFYAQAREKGIHLHLDIGEGVQERYPTDPARLRQILLNLVSNAIKFTERGSVTLTVCAVDGPQGAELQLVVEDTGIGIAEAHLKALFKPFSQVDSSLTRRYGGTGLGLSISREIAQRLGGDISVTSTVGQGTQFVVHLPVHPA